MALVDVRTGARHADGRLGGLGSEHCLEERRNVLKRVMEYHIRFTILSQ
jgi:hypothetical protein